MMIIFIGIFGLLGVLSRYFIVITIHKIFTPSIPYDIFFINILGSFLIGIFYALGADKFHINADLKIAIIVGFLGGFTTFSSYCLDAIKLIESCKYLQGILYVTLSPILGILATILGIYLARKM